MPPVTRTKPQKPAQREKTAQREKPQSPKAAQEGRNSVRIIGGGWRGRRVNFPDLPGLRPTPDRVRETLFNWLQHSIVDARCLDLFAGSGALGLEHCRAERRRWYSSSKHRPPRGGWSRSWSVWAAARRRVWWKWAHHAFCVPRGANGNPYGAHFDVVFVDPPYHREALTEFIPLIDAGDWVKPGGLVYLENERSAGAPVFAAALGIAQIEVGGRGGVSFGARQYARW